MPAAINGGAQQTPHQPMQATISTDCNIRGAAARQRPQASLVAQPAMAEFGSQQTAQQRMQASPFQRSAVPVLAERTSQQPMQASPFGHIFATEIDAQAEAQQPKQASQYLRSDEMSDIQPTARQPVQTLPLSRSSMTASNLTRGNNENRDPSARPTPNVPLEASIWAPRGGDMAAGRNGTPPLTNRTVAGRQGTVSIFPGSLQYFPARRAAE